MKKETESKDEKNDTSIEANSAVSSGCRSDSTTSEKVVKKKEYTVNVAEADIENTTTVVNNDLDDKTLPLDPAEFARQERLRKQREKQVIKLKVLMVQKLFFIFRQSFNRISSRGNSWSQIPRLLSRKTTCWWRMAMICGMFCHKYQII